MRRGGAGCCGRAIPTTRSSPKALPESCPILSRCRCPNARAARMASPRLRAGGAARRRRLNPPRVDRSKVFVRDHVSGKPVSLHWFWDDSVNRDGSAAKAFAKAGDLAALFPRTRFAAELAHPIAHADASSRWLGESHDLAVRLGYRSDAPRATSPEVAVPPAPAYLRAVEETAERRLVLSGYRLADVLKHIMKNGQQ